MPTQILTPKTHLSAQSEQRIQRHIDRLERRLTKFRNHDVTLTIRDKSTERRFTADAVVALGVDGVELVSHNSGETAEQAARLAFEEIERQLERYVATLRGEPSFGTPSRREPRDLRPAVSSAGEEDEFEAPPDIDLDEIG